MSGDSPRPWLTKSWLVRSCPGTVPGHGSCGLAEEGPGYFVPVRGHGLQLRGRLVERDVDDLVAAQRRHAAELPLLDEVGGLEAEAGREHTVPRRRRAAALDVAEDGDAGLVARPLLDLGA